MFKLGAGGGQDPGSQLVRNDTSSKYINFCSPLATSRHAGDAESESDAEARSRPSPSLSLSLRQSRQN